MAVNLLDRLHTDAALTSRYDKVILVDPLQYGVQKIPEAVLADPRYEFVEGSIYNPNVVTKVVGAGDLVIHLAAEVNSFTQPQSGSADDPVGYLKNLADARIGRLLFLSSADVYGVNDSADLVESDPVRPTVIYAAAKAAFEAYLSAFHALYGLPVVVFRPVTIYGPNQYPGWLVPRVITQALAGEQISITGDGSVRRDWIHISDVCDLLIKAALSGRDDVHGAVFNVGTGTEDSVLALTRHVLSRVGQPESLITFTADRPGDIPRQIAHAAKARRVFGWAPTTPLYEGLDTTIAWYSQHPQHPQRPGQ
ncbi:MAG: NAD-dependent epimerase/dehydratase family protein [Actinobacteria bacterium]|nr:NAD-dependent epimerase/dehydratase family protein [Actinomycetota bacterium]MBI3688615.1 NAD-dependent epimerase/dehydratase family protein [Actinomycetota bacterium]